MKFKWYTTAQSNECMILIERIRECFEEGQNSVTVYSGALSDLNPDNEDETIKEAFDRLFKVEVAK